MGEGRGMFYVEAKKDFGVPAERLLATAGRGRAVEEIDHAIQGLLGALHGPAPTIQRWRSFRSAYRRAVSGRDLDALRVAGDLAEEVGLKDWAWLCQNSKATLGLPDVGRVNP